MLKPKLWPTGGFAVRRLTGLNVRVEVDALVEFGQRELDADLGQGEKGAGDQDFVGPGLARPSVHGGADAVLLDHDVMLDGGGGLVFRGFDDPVVQRRLLGPPLRFIQPNRLRLWPPLTPALSRKRERGAGSIQLCVDDPKLSFTSAPPAAWARA